MSELMLNTGYGTFVAIGKIKVITSADSVRIKKEISRLRELENASFLIDCTKHKTIRSVIILDDGTHVLCAISQETLIKRLSQDTGGENEQG